eukprot:scaffold1307_cov200-Pinguiococcus_pyrenoidosus.AAC.133
MSPPAAGRSYRTKCLRPAQSRRCRPAVMTTACERPVTRHEAHVDRLRKHALSRVEVGRVHNDVLSRGEPGGLERAAPATADDLHYQRLGSNGRKEIASSLEHLLEVRKPLHEPHLIPGMRCEVGVLQLGGLATRTRQRATPADSEGSPSRHATYHV